MTTTAVLGRIPSSGQVKLTPVTAPPGTWITKITGFTNPSGATGIQATYSNGKTSNWCGAKTGDPYSFYNPTSFYATGGTTYAGYTSSVGPSSSIQFGPVGGKVWANRVCGAGQKLSGFTVYGNDASIYNIQGPACMTPPGPPPPPPPPVPKVQSCAPGQVISKVVTFKDATGKIIGMRYACSDQVYLPWVGSSSGGKVTIQDSATGGYGADIVKTAMGPNIVTPLVACPSGQAYNTITIDTTNMKVTPSKPTPIPPPQPTPVVSYSQYYTCPTGGFVNKIDSKNSSSGLGLQFTCGSAPDVVMGVNAAKQSAWYGTRTGIDGTNSTPLGYDQIAWTTDPTQGVTSITTLGAIQGSTRGSPSSFQCPTGQIINGVLGKWTTGGIQSLSFRCINPPYKVPTVTSDPVPVRVPEDSLNPPVVTPPPPPVPDPTGASDSPVITPPVYVAPELPPMEPIPDYTVNVPQLDLTSDANTYIMILVFLIVIAVAVLIGVKIIGMGKPTPTAPRTQT